MTLILGAIADDFTGATDLANTLVQEGMSVVQTIGVPTDPSLIAGADAVVVALKSRTCPASEAVAQSLAARKWLRGQGARQILFKYCSTFDSTPQGNIGPVSDALLEAGAEEFALICPAFPANGRTIYQGTLFVGDLPLAESPMKDHPLTPMRDSNLVRLMQAQSRHRVGLVPWQVVQQGPEAVTARVATLREAGMRYGVADALTETDLRVIGAAAASHGLITGGSGVALGLPSNFPRIAAQVQAPAMPTGTGSRAAVIAGSCSVATRGQIEAMRDRWPMQKIDVDAVAAGGDEIGRVTTWAAAQSSQMPVLIYGSADPAEVARTQERYGKDKAGAMVEATLAGIAVALRAKGLGRLIVAGGETSGAVVGALGIRALRIGPEIAPGVPWTEAIGAPPLALALKSGNFGGPDFFADAFAMF